MIRLRIATVAVATSLAFGAAAVPAVAASNGTSSPTAAYNFPALYKTAVTIGDKATGKTVTGHFAIERFVSSRGEAWAVGTLTGDVAGHHFARYGFRMPASLTGQSSGSASRAHAAATCPVLNLTLAPINLNLLGLKLVIGGGSAGNLPILINLTALSGTTPGAGLLGNLLCGLSSALNANSGALLTQLQTEASALSSTLNSLFALLP